MFLNAEIVACILSFRKLVTSQIWKILPNMFFSPIWGWVGGGWGGEWRRSEHAHASYPGLLVQSLYGAGRKESSGTGLGYFVRKHRLY